MLKLFFILPFLIFNIILHGQSRIDVLHYKFGLILNDKNDNITGYAAIKIKFLETASSFEMDLDKSMKVDRVTSHLHESLEFTFSNDKITVNTSETFQTNDSSSFIIYYHGVPKDGLIISKNKFGNRTFFADNWPNRAHYWIPCKDDPADKASSEFIIIAPSNYKVISNGIIVPAEDESPSAQMTFPGISRTHWKEDIPLPTKVMVIGVADFAVDSVGEVNGIPVSSWVFKENQTKGFYDYAQAKEVLAFFINYIGDFPYKKLANVQSKTIFGGMENAGAIFYYENSVTGLRQEEGLFAHEIAHQWFGDMATEKSFAHFWLSEGFATYLEHIYMESRYGPDKLIEEMKNDRETILAFSKQSQQPVVDSISPYKQLLNANSYQKGGWVLHMLRRQLGDSIFHRIIRNYYAAYAGKNADTRDFQEICEKESGKNLETFFNQWLYTPGQPDLEVKWKFDVKKKVVLINIKQLQKKPFQFPLDIALQPATGKSQPETLFITKQNQQFTIRVKQKPREIIVDPKTSLLFEGKVIKTN